MKKSIVLFLFLLGCAFLRKKPSLPEFEILYLLPDSLEECFYTKDQFIVAEIDKLLTKREIGYSEGKRIGEVLDSAGVDVVMITPGIVKLSKNTLSYFKNYRFFISAFNIKSEVFQPYMIKKHRWMRIALLFAPRLSPEAIKRVKDYSYLSPDSALKALISLLKMQSDLIIFLEEPSLIDSATAQKVDLCLPIPDSNTLFKISLHAPFSFKKERVKKPLFIPQFLSKWKEERESIIDSFQILQPIEQYFKTFFKQRTDALILPSWLLEKEYKNFEELIEAFPYNPIFATTFVLPSTISSVEDRKIFIFTPKKDSFLVTGLYEDLLQIPTLENKKFQIEDYSLYDILKK